MMTLLSFSFLLLALSPEKFADAVMLNFFLPCRSRSTHKKNGMEVKAQQHSPSLNTGERYIIIYYQ